jgi:hypothetical protein
MAALGHLQPLTNARILSSVRMLLDVKHALDSLQICVGHWIPGIEQTAGVRVKMLRANLL